MTERSGPGVEADHREQTDSRSSAPAVTRAAALLGLLAEPDSGSMGPTEIARRLNLPKSTVANLCSALEQSDLIRNDLGRYELGPRLLELSAAYLSKVDLFREFRETCLRLSWLSQEVVNLAVLEDTHILTLARHYGTQLVTLATGIGHRQPAWCTALGKAMLSRLEPSEVQARFAHLDPLPRLTPKAAGTVAELVSDLERVRTRDYAIDDEENTLGLVSYGMALPSSGFSAVQYAVSVSLLKARNAPKLRQRLLSDLHELTDALARNEVARHGPRRALGS